MDCSNLKGMDMPAILTHDFFGKDAFDIAAGKLGFSTMEEREAFLLGNQGPDPLFYLAADPLLHRYAKYAGKTCLPLKV